MQALNLFGMQYKCNEEDFENFMVFIWLEKVGSFPIMLKQVNGEWFQCLRSSLLCLGKPWNHKRYLIAPAFIVKPRQHLMRNHSKVRPISNRLPELVTRQQSQKPRTDYLHWPVVASGLMRKSRLKSWKSRHELQEIRKHWQPDL